jgi:hypothetical protein
MHILKGKHILSPQNKIRTVCMWDIASKSCIYFKKEKNKSKDLI